MTALHEASMALYRAAECQSSMLARDYVGIAIHALHEAGAHDLAEELTDAVWTAHVNGLSYARLGEFGDRVVELQRAVANRRVA